jgi:PLP dependent protein
MPFSDLPGRLQEVRDRIDAAIARGGHGQRVSLVAVTKTHGPEAVEAAWNAGLPDVGENRVQEAVGKMDLATAPVRWHLIGHLQRNKVKFLPRFHLFHAVDSGRLADAVHAFGVEHGSRTDVLLEVNVSGEGTKGGYALSDLPSEAARLAGATGLRIRGVMTMAPLGADESLLRGVFSGARRARDVLHDAGHDAPELSMGMSNDYEIAVEEGATLVRLGTILFGARSA